MPVRANSLLFRATGWASPSRQSHAIKGLVEPLRGRAARSTSGGARLAVGTWLSTPAVAGPCLLATRRAPETSPDTPSLYMLRLLYWLYESRLRRQIRRRPVPRHVGIILDGNRRHARKHGLADPRAAYDLGAENLDDVLAWCSDLAIPAVTLWVCSIDNLKRPQTEVAGILAAVEAKISALAKDPAIHRRRVRVKAVGRLNLLPPSTVTVLREAEQATADHDALMLTIAIAYGGREEIADAVRDDKVQQGADLDAIVGEITPS